MRYWILILLIGLLYSCLKIDDRELNKALALSGENRPELEKVLDHYKNDSLKYNAARYLIINSQYHHSLSEQFVSPDGDSYRPSLMAFSKREEMQDHCDSLQKEGYKIDRILVKDINVLKSNFLIENIELAFSVWQKPWARDVSFFDFCRYILPYRAQVEPLSYLRKDLMGRFMSVLDSANVTNTLDACIVLNESLKSIMKYRETGLPFYPTIEETYSSGFSQCDGICNLGTLIMRSVGIPVAVDFTTWTKMDLGHKWCSVLYNNRFYSFGPGEDQPLVHADLFTKIRHRRPAKVYRLNFDPNDYKPIKEDDDYRIQLKSKLHVDVTSQYNNIPINISIDVENRERKDESNTELVYLCVYNYYEWKPIAIGYYDDLHCSFEDVVGDNIFIVADCVDGETLRFVTAPFYVNEVGDVHKFTPNIQQTISFTFQKLKKKKDRLHTLSYWDTSDNRFKPLSWQSVNDSSQTYNAIPNNALLRFTINERILNQRVCFIKNDSLVKY